ncbi:long-distance movement protein [Paederia scandens chlorosis yellow umbravirus]|nr:long-distance movement protein [Paederia scandens chlorosis yellow umbravirus]
MASVINVYHTLQSGKQRATPQRPLRGGHTERVGGDPTRNPYPRQRQRPRGVNTTPPTKDPNKNQLLPPGVPPNKKYWRPVVRGEDRGGIHPTRSRRRTRGSRDLGARHDAPPPQQCGAESSGKAERRAKVDRLLPSVLAALEGHGFRDASLLLDCHRALRRQLREWIKPVQPAVDVAAADRIGSTPLPSETAVTPASLSSPGEGRADDSIPAPVPPCGSDVQPICNKCGITANKW